MQTVGIDTTRKRTRPAGWPTYLLIATVYTAFAALTAGYHALPWWLVLPAGGYLVALHGSLQHEVVHGHPSRSPRFNELLVFPSLWLWLPFPLYRQMHLLHHRDRSLTSPALDPESYYLEPHDWQQLPRWRQAFYQAHNTLTGRLLLGPPLAIATLITTEVARLRNGDHRHLRIWLWHALAVALVLTWVIGVCNITLLEYSLYFVYPGLALTLMRSYLEHRADSLPARRTAIVEANPLLALLYLNNNLHAAHHRRPWLPWYLLPQYWQQERATLLADNGGYYYSGYSEVIKRYWRSRKETPYHPLQ